MKRFRGEWSQDVSLHFHGAKRLWGIAHGANCPVRGGTSMGRTVNGATSPDTPQRRNSIVKNVFRHDKSSFAGERRLSPSFGYLHGPSNLADLRLTM